MSSKNLIDKNTNLGITSTEWTLLNSDFSEANHGKKQWIEWFESFSDSNFDVLFLVKNDVNFVHECGYLKNNKNHFCKKLEKILFEQNEDYLDYIQNEEESVFGKNVNK